MKASYKVSYIIVEEKKPHTIGKTQSKNQLFFDRHELAWELIGYICADEASAIIGKKSGFVAMVKKAPHIFTTHFVLHIQALISKTLPKKLKEVMGIVV